MNLLATLDPVAILVVVCIGEGCIIAAMAIWSSIQQVYIHSLHTQQIELVRDTVSTLTEVTNVVPNITRTLEATTTLIPQVKFELIQNLNSMETRLTLAVSKLSETQIINAPIDKIIGDHTRIGDNRNG